MNEVLTLKIVFIFSMLLSASIAGFLPLIIPAFHKSKKFLSLRNCFATGIFIIMGLAGLLTENIQEYLGSDMP